MLSAAVNTLRRRRWHEVSGFQLENRRKYPKISIFWPSFAISYVIIRLFADFLKLRLYVKKTHVHHFIFGLALMPFSWVIFSKNDDKLAWTLSGFIAALIASEVKELILDEWTP